MEGQYKSEREEKLLEQLLERYQALGIVVWGEIEGAPGTYAKMLVKSDGTVKVEGVTTISGSVDVSDRWARQLGQVDIARYLGSAMGVLNALHSQIVVSGAVVDPRSIRALLSSDVVTVYGSQTQALLQRATTYDALVQLRHQGAEINPQQIRALIKTTDELYAVLRTDAGVAYDARDRSWNLGLSDVPDLSDRAARLLGVIYGSQGQQLLQRATTYDLLVQLRNAGGEVDPRDVLDRAARLLGIIYGDQGQFAQRATTRDLYVQLRYAGSEIDPRLIQDVQKVVSPTYLTPTALGIGGTATIVAAPGSGYKLRLKGIQISVDAITRIDLRWGTTAWRSYYLPANGTIERNFISENIEGGDNQALTLLSSAAANVTASASTETLAV